MNIIFFYLGGEPNSIIMKKKLLKLKENKIFTNSNLPVLKNNKILIIKHFNQEMIENIKNLKKNKNIIIYEPIDYKWNLQNMDEYINYMNIFKYVDKIILPSKYCKKLMSTYINNSKLYYNYHEFDERFKLNTTKRDDNIYYIGDDNKSSLTKFHFKKYNLIHIKSSKNYNLLKNTYYPSIHIDYLLKKNIYYYFHTSTKLATALHFKSIFICNRIPIYEELLSKDYELFFKDDLSDINLVINKAKDIINNDIKYNEYLYKIKNVLDEFIPSQIYNKYNNIINE